MNWFIVGALGVAIGAIKFGDTWGGPTGKKIAGAAATLFVAGAFLFPDQAQEAISNEVTAVTQAISDAAAPITDAIINDLTPTTTTTTIPK